jgi:hypothetical protein
MIRKLNNGEVAEFEPPIIVSVAFLERESFTFKNVVKALKTEDGSIFLEFQDSSFAEIKPPYKFFQIGSEIESDES